MTYKHAVVWMDHQHATMIDFTVDDHHVTKLRSDEPQQLHRKSGPMGSGHAADDTAFFESVAQAIEPAVEVVVAGPGTGKTAFVKHLAHKHPALRRRVVAVETLDHPSDRELLAFARAEFRRIDSLLGNP